jgi:hypothetical protein
MRPTGRLTVFGKRLFELGVLGSDFVTTPAEGHDDGVEGAESTDASVCSCELIAEPELLIEAKTECRH